MIVVKAGSCLRQNPFKLTILRVKKHIIIFLTKRYLKKKPYNYKILLLIYSYFVKILYVFGGVEASYLSFFPWVLSD